MFLLLLKVLSDSILKSKKKIVYCLYFYFQGNICFVLDLEK